MQMIKIGRPMIAWNADGGSGGAGETPPAAAAAAAPSPESILFPKEGETPPATEPPAGDPPAADWKEYVADPAKSAEENAAAKAEHDKTKPAEPDALDVVPEDGKYTLTMPEGVTVDQELLDALGPKFAAKQMTPREAQELADEFIKIETDRATKRAETWANTINGWADTAKADKDIGGAKWNETVANCQRFTNAFGTPGLKEYLNASGGGNHPELIRIFAKAGALIKEDSPADGGAGGSGKPADPAHVLFPNDAPKG